MSEEITASYTLDVASFAPSYRWNYRKRGKPALRVAILVLVAVVVGALIVFEAKHGRAWWSLTPILVIPCLVLIFGSKLRSWINDKAVRKMPGYGETIVWQIREDGFENHLGKSGGFNTWEHIFESVTTPQGVLIYPQKDIFYWLPKTAFNSEADYNRFLDLLAAKTKHSKLG